MYLITTEKKFGHIGKLARNDQKFLYIYLQKQRRLVMM